MWVNRSGLSPKMSNVSDSLRLLSINERPWAIRSSRSEEMSHHEQIAQVAHQKWANEWITRFFDWIAHPPIFGQKTSDSLRKLMREFPALNSTHHDTSKINLTFSEFLIVSPFFWNVKKRKSDFCLFLCWNCDTVHTQRTIGELSQ